MTNIVYFFKRKRHIFLFATIFSYFIPYFAAFIIFCLGDFSTKVAEEQSENLIMYVFTIFSILFHISLIILGMSFGCARNRKYAIFSGVFYLTVLISSIVLQYGKELIPDILTTLIIILFAPALFLTIMNPSIAISMLLIIHFLLYLTSYLLSKKNNLKS